MSKSYRFEEVGGYNTNMDRAEKRRFKKNIRNQRRQNRQNEREDDEEEVFE